MNGYWTNFARTGNPEAVGLSEGSGFTAAGNELIDFRNDGAAVGEPDPERPRIDATELSEDKVVPR